MDIRDLVRTLLTHDLLNARQYVADAYRSGVDWSRITIPLGLTDIEMSVAAGLVELFASRTGVTPPNWTHAIGAAPRAVILDPGLEQMPRSFERARTAGPEPLRRRNIVALPDFLEVA